MKYESYMANAFTTATIFAWNLQFFSMLKCFIIKITTSWNDLYGRDILYKNNFLYKLTFTSWTALRLIKLWIFTKRSWALNRSACDMTMLLLKKYFTLIWKYRSNSWAFFTYMAVTDIAILFPSWSIRLYRSIDITTFKTITCFKFFQLSFGIF